MIAVIGGGISGLCAAYELHKAGVDFELFEGSAEFGGVIKTHEVDDSVLDLGADSMLSAKPWALELIEELGLQDEVISTRPAAAGSYIVRGGTLHEIPMGLRLMAPSRWLPFLASDLISTQGKVRAMFEPFMPRRVDLEDESLSHFVTRRLGREMLDWLAQPMISGIYGADPDRLSLRATMPMFCELEEQYGSVVRGLKKSMQGGDAQGARYSLFISLKRGTGALVEALVEALEDCELQLSSPVTGLTPSEQGWSFTAGSRQVEASHVILALGPRAQTGLLGFDPVLCGELGSVESHPAATINLLYLEKDLPSLPDGYGFIVPTAERMNLMACTFSSQKWEHRVADGRVLLRGYLGGPGRPEGWIARSDDQLIDEVRIDLAKLLNITAGPLRSVVQRMADGIPIYEVGHHRKELRVQRAASAYPGLVLAGNAFGGVGIPDCIHRGRTAARSIIRKLET